MSCLIHGRVLLFVSKHLDFSRAFSAQSSCDLLGTKCLAPRQDSFVEALTLNVVDGIW